MKTINLTTAVVLLILFCTAATTLAGGKEEMANRFTKRHEHGINGVISCWLQGASDSKYRDYLMDIVSAETNLPAYGISPLDERFVSRLIDVRSGHFNKHLFAYKLFRRAFKKETGWQPAALRSLSDKEFTIAPKQQPASHFTVQTSKW